MDSVWKPSNPTYNKIHNTQDLAALKEVEVMSVS
jgi:hypothetical protein